VPPIRFPSRKGGGLLVRQFDSPFSKGGQGDFIPRDAVGIKVRSRRWRWLGGWGLPRTFWPMRCGIRDRGTGGSLDFARKKDGPRLGVTVIESELEAFWVPRKGDRGHMRACSKGSAPTRNCSAGSARFIAIFWVMRGSGRFRRWREYEGASAARISCFGRFQTGCSAGSGTGCSTRGSGAGSGLSLSR